MRILMLNPFFHPYAGGTEKHVLEVGKRLARKHDVTVLTAQIKGTRRREEIHGISVVRTPSFVLNDLPAPLPPPLPIMPGHNVDLKKLAQASDVVHIHNRFVYGLSESGIVKKLEKSLCITLHNARPQGIDFATDFWGQAYDDTVGKVVMNRCDGALGVSRYTLDVTLPKKFGGRKDVAYNGVDAELYKPRKNDAAKRELGLKGKTVFCVARFVKQKGLNYMIQAMRYVDASLILLGRGPLEKELRKQAQKQGGVRIITERIPEKRLALLYSACDCFVLPSLWEPFGMVLVEAMASARPCVATKVGGIPEVVENGKNGLLVEPREPKALAEAINSLLDDEKKAGEMGRKARESVVKKFTWDNTAKAYEKLYARL